MSDDSSSVASSSSSSDESEQPTTKKQCIADPLELAPTNSKTSRNKAPRIIVLLDQASLETVKNRRGVYELLNCDDHRELCRTKLKRDPNEFRPDILHQELLTALDSPLNKAGMLQVYIRSTKGNLIEVNPAIRIPRTFKRFSGLMVQLLHKMKIKAATESTTLLKVIKNPFSQHLPPGSRCYGFSSQGTLYSPIALARKLLPESQKAPTCFIVGAMSTGHVTIEDHPYIEEMLSISEYPLSGAAALSRIMGGVEHHWGIV